MLSGRRSGTDPPPAGRPCVNIVRARSLMISSPGWIGSCSACHGAVVLPTPYAMRSPAGRPSVASSTMARRPRHQYGRACRPRGHAWAQEPSLRRLRRWRRQVGHHQHPDHHRETEQRRTASLDHRRPAEDDRRSSHQLRRRTPALKLGCGLTSMSSPRAISGRLRAACKRPFATHWASLADSRFSWLHDFEV